MNNKDKYRELCEKSKRLLIFQTPLWLDAVAGEENWNVILTFKGDVISGAFPYVQNTKFSLRQITLPFLTPYLGPIIFFPNDLKKENYLSFKRKVTSEIISQIPNTERFITQTDFEFDYWAPFAWEGYQQTTRYTFLLDTNNSETEIFNGFKSNIKKHIRKSEAIFTIETGHEIDPVFSLHEANLKAQGINLHFNKNQFKALDTVLAANQKRKILHAKDSEGNIICALYLVFDNQYTHYIMGAVSSSSRNSGVMSLLMWEAIKESKKRMLTFNFEGSMNKNIEQFFASFGGVLTPYMQISKVNNPLLKQFSFFNYS